MLTHSLVRALALVPISVILTSTLSSCTRSTAMHSNDLQDPSAKPPALVEASLTADASKRLTVRKQALDKEFLLHGSYAAQERNATSHGLKGRVITFHRSENSVFLLESTEGRLISDDVPTQIILAELPILVETDDSLTVDFNAGMRSVFMTAAAHASDFSGTSYSQGDFLNPVATSFIDSIRNRDNTLEIRQIARVDSPSPNGGAMAETYELRYYLTPYRPTEGFVVRETSDFRKVGYFETQPVLEHGTGNTRVHILRRDENKIFTYSISANTPLDKIQSIRDGVLYWNKVFGREVVRVEIAPKGVSAPDSSYNVIQWVNDSSTASAYADQLNDPRTGEILHSQIFLHSGLFEGKGAGLVGLVRRLNHMTEKSEEKSDNKSSSDGATSLRKSRTKLVLKNLTAEHLCEFDFSKAIAADARSLLSMREAVTPEMLERMASSYVTFAVAHEVGHTLGLRHNFAGSLATQLTIAERDATMVNFLKTGEIAPDLILSSSVMEYAQFTDSALIGAQIQAGNTVLPYDKAAIEWGYRGIEMPANSPLYCSDADSQRFADCKIFDVGSFAIMSNAERMGMLMRTIPIVTIEEFIRIKTDQKSPRTLDTEALLSTLNDTLADQIGWLTDMTRPSLQVDRDFGEQTSNLAQYQMMWINAQVSLVGDVDKLLFAHLPATDRPAKSFSELGTNELDAYLARPEVIEGIGYDGKPYQLSPEEITRFRQRGEAILQSLDDFLQSTLLSIYGQVPLVTTYSSTIENRLGAIAEEILLKRDLNPATESAEPRAFHYSDSKRLRAASLLNAKNRPTGFGEPQRLELIDSLRAIIKAELGAEPESVNVRKLSAAQREWFNTQRLVLNALQDSAKSE